MQVIVFASQKGGSGKTTLAGHMAVMADSMGLGPVAMLDTDPQGSLAQWWNARQASTPLFVRSSLTELPETLAEMDRRGIRLVIIDTPPAITVAIRSVVENADLVVVPVRPSPHDLRAAGATVDLVEGLDRPFVFVVNAASARARITSDAAVALSQHGTVAPLNVNNRTEYAASMSDGRTVMEVNPEGRSAEEMRTLWDYLKDRLDRAARQPGRTVVRRGTAFADFVREAPYDVQPHGMGEFAPQGADPDAGLAAGPVAEVSATPAGARPSVPGFRPLRAVEPDNGYDDDLEDLEDDTAGGEHGGPAPWALRSVPGGSRGGDEGRARAERPMAAPAPSYAARGVRPAPAQGRGALAARHAFGRRGSVEA
ncbi:AAA family ATPase [uncultured Rhodospira sp.]|uniref:AAA family ATPase n=1 Tax=uncultured Rhodospira sp. TaxID=1936189 RepID=UPI00260B2271|nr:AAA family ATPase [uncultured Rhodospira sp.]